MRNRPSSAVIAVERVALEQRLCFFIASESADFANKYGVVINSISTDVIPFRMLGEIHMTSFVASVQVGITEVSRGDHAALYSGQVCAARPSPEDNAAFPMPILPSSTLPD